MTDKPDITLREHQRRAGQSRSPRKLAALAKKAEEFEQEYAKRSRVTVEWLRQQGREVRPCDCGEPDCEGWQMAHVRDDEWFEKQLGKGENMTKTDTEIRKIVADVLEREECWADALDRALTDAGVELHSQQPDGSRMQDIVRLADGRIVRLCDESQKGYLQYRIEEDE